MVNKVSNLGKEFYGELLKQKTQAEIAQLVEHNLAKVGVAGPSPVFRSLLLQIFFRKTFLFSFLTSMNLYIRYFDEEILAHDINEALDFLYSIPDRMKLYMQQ